MSNTTTHEVSPTRTLDGHVLPAPGAWEIDPGHTEVAFIGRHFMVTKVRGRFTDVSGTVVVAPHFDDSKVDVTINLASVESGSEARDTHIKSPDLFDVEHFPTATFRSTSVDWHRNGGVVHGDLTIHGVTRNVPLSVTFDGHVRDPWEAIEGSFPRAPRSTARTSASRGTSLSRPAASSSPRTSRSRSTLETVLNRAPAARK